MAKKQNLADQNLDHANLAGSDLSGADLSRASLRHARLTGANLARARLAECDLHGAHLEHTDVADADLRNADLTEADLHGVDLRRAATIDGARLAGARGVDGDLADRESEPEQPMQLERWLDQLAALNREIAASVREVFEHPNDDPASDARREKVDALLTLQRRRNLLEETVLEEIEETMPLHAGSTIDDP